MGRYNGVLMVLLLWCLTLATNKSSFCNGNPKMICREKERKALLGFKQGLADPLNQLSSWNGLDCCMWKGVGCDNTTGHVVKLNLTWSALMGEVSDSLLELKHLHYMDLSYNLFGGHIPKSFGSLANLRYLDLHHAGFSGVIPDELGNLSSLHYLNLGKSPSGQSLYVADLGWISRLPVLEFLDMSGIDLSEAPNWLQVMNMLPSLLELRLSSCRIGELPPLPSVNFSSLVVLDLSYNYNSMSNFEWFTSLSSLVQLDLSCNNFDGPIPFSLQNMTALRFLNLSSNYFNSTLPEWLYNLTSLESLRLSDNNLQGQLSIAIGNLTLLTELDLSHNSLQGEIPESLGDLHDLRMLDVSFNQLNGLIPESFGHLSKLEQLHFSHNRLNGSIPGGLGHLSQLERLEISQNQLKGTIPEGLGHLTKLIYLDISQNFLEGVVSEVHFANLTRLKVFLASSNMLTLQVSSNWTPVFQLYWIEMGSWNLGPQFPAWLRTQNGCGILDLSSTKISDVIPTWLWSLSKIYDLDLSHNQIHGNIPVLPFFGERIHLGSNNFTGPLPQVSPHLVLLDFSNNSFNGSLSPMLCQNLGRQKWFEFLDLSSNLLSGELPDCWMSCTRLGVLKLGNNNLTGKLPISMASLLQLKSLNLRNNGLSGKLPLWLDNWKRLMVLDLSENDFSGTISTWMGKSMIGLKVLALRSNKLSGGIPRELCNLNSLQILDLADNNLSGTIPQCLSNFSAMVEQRNSAGPILDHLFERNDVREVAMLVMKGMEYEYSSILALVTSIDLSCNSLSGVIPEEVTSLYGLLSLNLSTNHLLGKIPEKISAMKSLESLDLSMNRLSGVIPQSMAELSFLGHLNLSFNNFSGKIPSGTQLQSFSPLSFIGNHELCGPPLTDHCIGSDAQHQIPKAGDDKKHGGHGWIDMKWFYMSIPFGFVVGFWGVCGPLAFNKAWRYASFRFLDDMEYKLWSLRYKCKCL